MVPEVSKTVQHNAPPTQENVDPDEIATFDAIASHWWDCDGAFKSLHRINPLRLNYILERAGGLFGKSVLDLGCGGGILAESMAREGAEVTALDISAAPLAVARLHALTGCLAIDYREETVETHADSHACAYDVVTCMEMLEHVPDPESVVRSCAGLVKPGGEVFFSTINRTPKAWLIAIVSAEYVLRMVPKGTHNINRFIKPAELLSWVDETLLSERHIIGVHYNLLWDHFYLGSNVDVNYMLHTHRKESYVSALRQ
ncbi:bifunctional 2-polyprenyl-6-hydroxyphenol methylase/3-demethylubiquinol 3-O-methyltransferase UbiG [secondary endosymbiont of Ctenarytaina eucalypti]|uniref:Ubiquinone biosynthesis O-methyltransferase n=1 Tax=secondary endosymbiont of Ctenarytaina eucalypti TaxID=1199245 RepID=J3Z2U7_9ENTR|nr:bifunctional 2-polyprenyl-6-hydroxyphenol methylase/3-demethylubiquinol 3-O-methyltransferase UbiG [secondary endosymbiont of Ctenarytaina eucalypti]AFP84529.1 3-demethylubiquinone-9 3-methyltransferase [secondary endosymbiont of Ctenarytaina eucalypti]